MNRKSQQNTHHANVNVNLMAVNVIQIKSGITINVDMSVKVEENIRENGKYLESIIGDSGDRNYSNKF